MGDTKFSPCSNPLAKGRRLSSNPRDEERPSHKFLPLTISSEAQLAMPGSRSQATPTTPANKFDQDTLAEWQGLCRDYEGAQTKPNKSTLAESEAQTCKHNNFKVDLAKETKVRTI
ncbi:unnamed protein product [Prunus armeniaca]|uniref:Uncharacterized protein n=1 Tax=Prunus armeniaca TaxID=36596 RepID=A0A6J5XJM8_PRUAR|nr:unnamed protein product [Prunus armeniaca]